MKTKEEIIEGIKEASASKAIKDMVLLYVDAAYSAGFTDGMMTGSKVQSAAFEMLQKSLEKK